MLPSEILQRARESLAGGDVDDCLYALQHVLAKIPSYYPARLLRGLAYERSGKLADALDDAVFVLQVDPASVEALLLTGRIFERRGDLRESRKAWMRAAEIEPGHPTLPKLLAAVAPPPLSAAALGYLYLHSGWPELAARQFRAAVEADGARIDLRLALAEALWISGQYEDCRRHCRTVLDHHPDCLKATLMMANLLTEVGRTNHGAEFVERAGMLDPEYRLAADMYGCLEFNRMRLPAAPSVDPLPPPRSLRRLAEVAPAAGAFAGEYAAAPEPATLFEPVTATASPDVPSRVEAQSFLTAAAVDPVESAAARSAVAIPAPPPAGSEPALEAPDSAGTIGEKLEQASEAAPRLPTDDRGRAFALARDGAWNEVVDLVANRALVEDAQEWEGALVEILKVQGAPAVLWQTLGDIYMRQSRPHLAADAYSRAVGAESGYRNGW